jgi:hypothetical protein
MGATGTLVLPNDCKLKGYGRSGGGLVRMSNPGAGIGTPFIDVGLRTVVEDLMVWCGPGTQGGIALSRNATNADNAAQDNVIRNVFITGFGSYGPETGSWYCGLSLDSTLGEPNYGSRSCVIDGLAVHRYTDFGIILAGHNAGTFSNMDLEASVPGFVGIDLYVNGAANQTTNVCYFSGGSLDKLLVRYTNSSYFAAGAIGAITVDATCTGILMDAGAVAGVPTLNGTAIRVQANKNTYSSAS